MYKKTKSKVFLIWTLATMMSFSSLIGMAGAASEDGVKYEFEDGVQNGAKIYTDYVGKTEDGTTYDLSGATCTYIAQTGTSTSVNVVIEKAGLYELIVRYAQPFDKTKKIQYLDINNSNQGEVSFTYTTEWKEMSAGIVKLNAGTNNIEFDSYWGYTFFDYLIVKPADEKITNLKVEKKLSNPDASDEAKALMSYLCDIYGKNILSGQQEMFGGHNYEASEADFTYIMEKTGKQPAVRGFDFANYRGNGLGWNDECAERVIEWYNEKNGIPALCWHWFSPGDIGEKGDGSFYTEQTTFSISKALTPGTEENKALLSDIDFMAGKLKQVRDAGVPVLFRPLHEAEGGWFWWGAEGPEPCKELYRLLYDKFTNEYGINNLIWVWNSYTYSTSPAWYPGDDVVDIVGYDKYNAKDGKPNGSAIASTFYNLVKLTNGNKLIAMTENDTIPQVKNLIDEAAGWLYFCPWYGYWLTGEQNNPVEWLNEIYNSDYCITLDELPVLKTYSTEGYNSTPTSTSTPTHSEVILGDVNGDGSVNSIDFGYYRKYLLGTIDEFPAKNAMKAADLNGDGSVNSIDFGYLRMYLLDSSKEFPAKK